MIEITEWGAKNYVLFDSVRWKVREGVHFLLGKNTHRRSPRASNAAGKSLLIGILPTLLFDTHSVVVKGGKAVQRSMYGKDTSAEVAIKQRGSTFVFRKHGSKTYLYKNGKDLDSRVARESLKKLFPLTEEEFFSTVYVDGRRYAGFLLGTAADRAAFITGLFRLDRIDEIRQQINRQVNDLRASKAQLDTLSASANDLRERLSGITVNEEMLDRAKAAVESLGSKISTVQQELQKIAAFDIYQKAEKALQNLGEPSLTRAQISEYRRAWKEYHQKYAVYEEAQKAKALLKKSLTREILLQESDMLKKREQLLENKPRKASECKEPKSKKYAGQEDKVKKLLSTLEHQAASIKTAIRDMQDLSGECPTCMQEIKKTHITGATTLLKNQLAEIEQRMEKARSALENAEQCANWKAWQEYSSFTEQYAEVQNYPFDDVRRWKSIPKQELPQKPKVDEKTLLEQAALHEKIDSHTATLKTLSSSKPSLTKSVALERLEALTSKMSSLQAKLPKMESSLSMQKMWKAELQKINTSIEEITASLKDLPVLELLQQAYSSKGVNVKTALLSAFATQLQNNLNIFAKHVFEEGFTFTLNVEPSKFDVMVSRRNGASSDVRYFSGAESRLFAIVFLLAILPMIPDSRRTNILILDEPTANMDDAALEIFRDVLLPQLQKIVPSVIVVSPNPEIVPQHAPVFTVLKKNGKSKLLKGYV